MQDPTCGVPMLLWAAEAHLVPEHGNVVHWQGTVRATGTRSLTQYIEVHAEEVRRRYLAWFYEALLTAIPPNLEIVRHFASATDITPEIGGRECAPGWREARGFRRQKYRGRRRPVLPDASC